jgi:hypothetical protein
MNKMIPVYYLALLLITCFFPISASSPIDSTDIIDINHTEGKTNIFSSSNTSGKSIDSIPITDNIKLTANEIKSEVVKYRRMFGWGCVLAGTGASIGIPFAYFALKYKLAGNHFSLYDYMATGFFGIISTGSLAGGTVMIAVGHKRAKRYSQQLKVGIEFTGPQITFSLYKHQ